MHKSELINRIDVLTSDFSLSKYNLLKISYLVRLVEESENFSLQCDICKENKKNLVIMVEEIPMLDDINHRQPYEKKFNQIRKHFHDSHGFIAPYRYSATYTILGLVLCVLMLVPFLFFFKIISIDLLFAFAIIGVITGYFIGSVKELKYRKIKKMI